MSLNITLKDGNGSLFPNPDANKPNSPKLEGFLTFNLDDREDGPKLRLDVAAWVKRKDDIDYYSISAGGLNGALFPEKEKKHDDSPDYTGTLGPNRELRFAAWKKRAKDTGAPYLSISISEHSRQARAPQRDQGSSFI